MRLLFSSARPCYHDLFAPSEISSPTVSTNSVIMLIAMAVTEKRHFITFDIAQAYLNADNIFHGDERAGI